MTLTLLFACMICLAAGLVFLWRARAVRLYTGLPPGEVVYMGTRAWARPDRPLFSEHYRLTGRPDYLVRHKGQIIPVEVKTTRGVKEPPESHVWQLLAYCLLVEESEHRPPLYGLLKYPETTFRIPYTSAARLQLLTILERLRADLQAEDAPRSHSDPRRCQACGFRPHCSQSL